MAGVDTCSSMGWRTPPKPFEHDFSLLTFVQVQRGDGDHVPGNCGGFGFNGNACHDGICALAGCFGRPFRTLDPSIWLRADRTDRNRDRPPALFCADQMRSGGLPIQATIAKVLFGVFLLIFAILLVLGAGEALL